MTAKHEQILNGVLDQVFTHYGESGFAGLTSGEKIFLCVWSLIGEVDNGGFEQYYWNSSGDHAVEAVESLATIGAHHTSKIVREGNAIFGEFGPTSDWDERHDQMESQPDRVVEEFERLDEMFGEEVDDLTALLAAYVEQNRKEFPNS